MAGRSFRPMSYSHFAGPPAKRSPRPSFNRTPSASSTKSTKSEDSFITALRNLTTADNTTSGMEGDLVGSLGSAGSVSAPHSATPVHSPSLPRQVIEDTPGRKRSQPIAIQPSSRNSTAAYTPLSARGDLPGGYFPNHESSQRSYKYQHPFSQDHRARKEAEPESIPNSPSPSTMSTASSCLPSPSTTKLPYAPPTAFHAAVPVELPEAVTMPLGKYHPSNYKLSSPPIPTGLPTSTPLLSPTNLSIPSSSYTSNPQKNKSRSGQERRGSDVKRKLQEYQRLMIAQAQMASAAAGGPFGSLNPTGPHLLPLGSPGPITPLELEGSLHNSYMVAGPSARRQSLSGNRVGKDSEMEVVGRMIMREEERRDLPT